MLIHEVAASADPETGAGDLGPLAWVLDELRKSLDGAAKSLRRYVRETEAARGTDLESVDASQLRMARQQLHQAVGAMEMVGHGAPAQVLRGMEAAVQQFVQHPDKCSESAAATLERAGFALIEYLEGVLAGKPLFSVGLFPQFRDVQQLAGADRIHPADLWTHAWRWIDPVMPAALPPVSYGPSVRTRMDQGVLKFMKNADANAASELSHISLGLARAQTARQPAMFWKLAAGFFEALGQSLLSVDMYVKRAASRVLLQYASLARGEEAVSDRLAQDLLFFCAQALPAHPADAPHLAAVRLAYGLDRTMPVDYEVRRFGQFDPALLAQARKRIEAIKESWSSLSGGDMARLKNVGDQFSLVADSLVRLHPSSAPLARALQRAAELTLRSGQPPGTELAMEVATSVLYLEAAFADLDPQDPQLAERTGRLAERLEQVCGGHSAQPLEAWMEELYRRVNDRQTIGTVVGELRITLNEVEKALDQFFRNPADQAVLGVVPGLLQQMGGVLSVLGLDQAALAVRRMHDNVEQIVAAEADDERARAAGIFEKLGNSVGALGFLVDMLNYQPALARKLFVYDEVLEELRPLMGRTSPAEDDIVIDDDSLLSEEACAMVMAAATDAKGASLPAQLDTLATRAALAGQTELARSVSEAAAAVATADADAVALAMERLSEVVAPATEPLMPTAATEGNEVEEDDLRDIFLEEAREVIQAGREALRALAAEPRDLEQQTTLRRAFHTLKGSSRMVGLTEFGEAAWSMEQLLNAWLSEQKPLSEPVRDLSSEALQGFERWVEDIAHHRDGAWQATAFGVVADALRLQGQRLPLLLPGEAGALLEPVPGTATAPEEAELHLLPADAEAPALAEVPSPDEAPSVSWTDAFESFDFTPQALVLEPVAPEPAAPTSTGAEAELPELTDLDFDLTLPPEMPALLEIEEIDLASLAAVAGPLPGPEADQQPDLPQETAPADPFPEPVMAVDTAPAALEVEELQMDDLPPEFAAADLDMALPDIGGSAEEPAPVMAGEPLAWDDAGFTPDVQLSGPAPLAGLDEQVKVIGDLSIGIPLYNVYLNEADEWSRRLMTDLAEWSMELHRPIPETALALAHSLAGSSATVGFKALSGMARALEHALERVQGQASGSPHQGRVFNAAAEDIRRLLHQFAAGFLKEPSDAVLQALSDVEAYEPPAPQAVVIPMPVPVVEPAPFVGEEVAAAHQELASSVIRLEGRRESPSAGAVIAPVDDDMDLVDTIDPDLFPIFEEEAAELLPQLGGALRQWVGRPDNLGARAEVLRALHTLKGSARLAGALRLGEMAHRMESGIESLGSDTRHSQQIEPLLSHLDGLQAGFDALRHADQEQAESAIAAASALPVPEATLSPPVEDFPGQAASSEPPAAVRSAIALPAAMTLAPVRAASQQAVRVRSQLLDRLVNQAGEVMITRSRLEAELGQLRGSLQDLTGNLDRLRHQLRDIELQAETQMQSRLAQAKDSQQNFDPLEFDRFTRVQELTRMMAESVNDVATVQRNLQRTVEATEDDLIAQARQTRQLQRDLLRTRMVEFEGISERLYRVVRQASKDTGKQVKLDITGGSIEMDRGVLDRMTPAFEHLLRNCVVHGIEDPAVRTAAGKEPAGTITIDLHQSGNDVSVEFRDDGAGLDLARIRDKARQQGLIQADQLLTDAEAANLIFMPGFTTAAQVTELAGRGIGMDVVRAEVQALGGRIETHTQSGQGAAFKLVLPLTTAVTQVVMVRSGHLTVGVPANVVELVRRATARELQQAYNTGTLEFGGETVPFFWSGALLQSSARSHEPQGRTLPVVIFRSAAQRVAVHLDEVLGNQEVVVKNLGPQLSRLPGLAGMTVLASGAVVLIYNPVALASVYGEQARLLSADQAQPEMLEQQGAGHGLPAVVSAASQIPLVLVVDDSITVRRVTQRLLQREGYRVALAADGLQALERLQEERPAVVLSDIEMPRMDGFDLTRNIRADARLRDLPVIMITSRIAEKHREHARELGVNHYLGKPYSEEELLSLVRRYTAVTVPA